MEKAIDSQLSILLPEGNYAINRQLYSGLFTLREAASFIFHTNGKDLMQHFLTGTLHTAALNGHLNSCPSSGSEATSHEKHLHSDWDKFTMKLSHEHHLHGHGQITLWQVAWCIWWWTSYTCTYFEGTKGITKLHIHNKQLRLCIIMKLQTVIVI